MTLLPSVPGTIFIYLTHQKSPSSYLSRHRLWHLSSKNKELKFNGPHPGFSRAGSLKNIKQYSTLNVLLIFRVIFT